MKKKPLPWYAPPGKWNEAPWHLREWRKALAANPAYSVERFSGRGIVFSAGGERLFTNLWVNLCLLRRVHRCSLPVEVWHFGEGEMNPSMTALLEPFDVRVVNGESLARDLPGDRWRGFALKSLAVVHSRFEEVLFLDTDSYPVRDPSFLFEERAYRWTGSCFWPNIWRTDPDSKFWEALDLPFVDEADWESGQMVINKRRCWRALSLVEHLNRHFAYYYQHVYGDAMTFYGAWKKLGQPYAMTVHPVKQTAAPDGRMLLNQFDFEGGLLFQHRTNSDWDLIPGSAPGGPDFAHQKACEEFLDELREKWPEEERDCAENLEGKSRGAHPTLWERLIALGPRAKPHVRKPLTAKPLSDAEQWENLTRQVLQSPGLACPRLMGTGIEALREFRAESVGAIVRFFAALIFIDPRLGGMLPEDLELDGVELHREWAELREFKHQASRLPGVTGLLPVHGNCHFPNPDANLTSDERGLSGRLEKILDGSGSRRKEREIPAPEDIAAASKRWRRTSWAGKVLVLTPVKNAADLAEDYCSRLARLSYPPELLSAGLLESDSTDGTYEEFERALGCLRNSWRSVGLWKKDYHYSIPEGYHRWHSEIQLKRREILSQSRNELLRRALNDEEWVLWLDVDVIEYPHDIIEQLLSYGKEILHPHCVLEYGGTTFDRNAWRDQGRISMQDLRGQEILSPLDAVGGTMLWIRADLHRKGLIFPPRPYGLGNPRVRPAAECFDPENPGEIETEGLGIMASDMNVQCWGLPNLEILHRKK